MLGLLARDHGHREAILREIAIEIENLERFGARFVGAGVRGMAFLRSEEHTSELQSLMCISYAVFCLKTKTPHQSSNHHSARYTTMTKYRHRKSRKIHN